MRELLTVDISQRRILRGILKGVLRGFLRGILRPRNILVLSLLRSLPGVFGSCQRGHEKPPSGATGSLEVHVAHDLHVSARHWWWKSSCKMTCWVSNRGTMHTNGDPGLENEKGRGRW